MTQLEALVRELEQEAPTTRKLLALVPTGKFDWKPHEKSMAMGRLATHIAELPTWLDTAFSTDELDFENNPYAPKTITTNEDLLVYFDESLATGRAALANGDENVMDKPWSLRSGATVYSTEPRRDVLRMAMSQVIHHRAQLGVYLRLLNIPIPRSYGPSADDTNF